MDCADVRFFEPLTGISPFDPSALAARKLPYEKLDQLVTELLLGVL